MHCHSKPMRVGYCCINLSINRTTNRGIRLKNATHENIARVALRNLDDLAAILEYNMNNGFALFRIGSEIIPFWTYEKSDFDWLGTFYSKFREIGKYAIAHGMRLSMHPGQYVNLNSPREDVVKMSYKDISSHVALLDAMGLSSECKVILHIGGAYGDKDAAKERFVRGYAKLEDNEKARVAIENDERIYNVDDLIEVAGMTGAPVVFDAFHHRLNPGTSHRGIVEAMSAAFATWRARDGLPKVHFSTDGKTQGAHGYLINMNEFATFAEETRALDFDIMLESKAKDLSAKMALDWLIAHQPDKIVLPK